MFCGERKLLCILHALSMTSRLCSSLDMVRRQLDERQWGKIECTFSLLKQARRFATRYEKTLRNYAAVVALGCALLWLRI